MLLEFDLLRIYYNDDRTKGFAGWVCGRGAVDTRALIDRIDPVAENLLFVLVYIRSK